MDAHIISRLLETINCAIVVVGPDNTIILSNTKAKEIFLPKDRGQTENLEGLPIKMLFLPDDHDVFLPNVLKVTKEHGEFEGEALLRSLDGRHFFALIATSVCPINGKTGVIFTIHDITNLKNIERLLKKSERLAYLGRMLEDISHQIRNPVLAIGGFARRMDHLDGVHKRYTGVILYECARLENLLERLTEFIRLPRPSPIPARLDQLIECLKGPVEKVAKDHAGTVLWRLPTSQQDQKVLIDHKLLPRAVVPVVQNAFESYISTSEGPGKVEIKIEPIRVDNLSCRLQVIDSGQGIMPKLIDKVFDPFFTTKTGHIGMGLTFAKRIAEELSGEIEIESTLGQGTTVTILFCEDRRRPIRREAIHPA